MNKSNKEKNNSEMKFVGNSNCDINGENFQIILFKKNHLIIKLKLAYNLIKHTQNYISHIVKDHIYELIYNKYWSYVTEKLLSCIEEGDILFLYIFISNNFIQFMYKKLLYLFI